MPAGDVRALQNDQVRQGLIGTLVADPVKVIQEDVVGTITDQVARHRHQEPAVTEAGTATPDTGADRDHPTGVEGTEAPHQETRTTTCLYHDARLATFPMCR